jgi:hypothetical protein
LDESKIGREQGPQLVMIHAGKNCSSRRRQVRWQADVLSGDQRRPQGRGLFVDIERFIAMEDSQVGRFTHAGN